MTFSSSAPWLIIDTSHAGQLRFASVAPAARPRIEQVVTLPVDGLPTFTDALQAFERQSGHALRGSECVLAMPGVVSGEMLTMVRSRWTISRAGLTAMFGRRATIVNDVAARAWALRGGTITSETVRGIGSPNLQRSGRYLMLLVEDGVGAAVVDVDADGQLRVLETEAGHMDFAPSNERETKLASALKGAAPFVSWEKLLTLDADSPVWREACPEVAESERPRLVATMLGRFAVNLVHAYGAWNGVMLAGGRVARLVGGTNRSSFDVGFGAKREFARLLMGVPVWRVDQREAVLAGGAELLAQALAQPAAIRPAA